MGKETEKSIERASEYGEGVFCLYLNKNTCFLNTAPVSFSAEQLSRTVPGKVRTRIRLNEAGLNGLATTIVSPDVMPKIDLHLLRRVLEFSNKVNDDIGLPTTDDLILRSSQNKNYFGLQTLRVKTSEPALLIQGVNSTTPKFKLLAEDLKRNLSSLEEFKEIVGNYVYLMIHDDNYDMQINSLHGAAVETSQVSELICRVGSLHARSLGDPDLGIPTVRVNDNRNLEDLLPVKPGSSVTGICVEDKSSIISLVKKAESVSDLLVTAYKKVLHEFGNGVMEFRSYPVRAGGVGEKLHVLDVNQKF